VFEASLKGTFDRVTL